MMLHVCTQPDLEFASLGVEFSNYELHPRELSSQPSPLLPGPGNSKSSVQKPLALFTRNQEESAVKHQLCQVEEIALVGEVQFLNVRAIVGSVMTQSLKDCHHSCSVTVARENVECGS